jgi:hypothetical protein
MPYFVYNVEKIEFNPKEPTHEDIHKFIENIFVKLNLVDECLVITLIYLEKIMVSK